MIVSAKLYVIVAKWVPRESRAASENARQRAWSNLHFNLLHYLAGSSARLDHHSKQRSINNIPS